MKQENRIFEAYEHLKKTLEADNINVSNYKLINYGLQFNVSVLDWSGIIRIYQNSKGALKVDYSQLKDDINALRIKTLMQEKRILYDGNKKHLELGFPIIGTDESGKGDYFGPLVSAGIYVDNASAKALIASGVKDSKKLGDSKNLELAQEIMRVCRGRFAVIEISPEKYNDLYEQFKKENKNLNALLAWGHAKAIEEILSKVDCKVAIADQFSDESFILSKLQEKGKRLKLIQMHKAENNIAVAASSILARARFLTKLSKLSEDYNIDLLKGASQAVVENAKKFVNIHGKNKLRKVAKLHFKVTTKVLNKYSDNEF